MNVVVTGASSGIGEAIARTFLQRGAHVTMVARRRDRLARIAEGFDAAKSKLIEADLATGDIGWFDPEGVDVLINNAGVQIVRSVVETPWEDAERLLRLDLLVPLKLTQRALPAMTARGTGTIVDVASMAAIAPTPGMFFYNAAKAGLGAASEGLRAEVKRQGIHVVTVYPGPVTSDMEAAGRAAYVEAAASKHAPTGSPDVLAALIYRAVVRKHDRIVYPRVYGLARHFPNMTRWALDTLTPPLKQLPT